MLGSSILEVVIGLFLIFFVFSTLCSGVAEAVSRFTRLRGDYLLRGLRHMLDGAGSAQRDGLLDRTGQPATTATAEAGNVESLCDKLLRLPIIATFGQQKDADPIVKRAMPSYLPAHTFSAGIIDLLVPNDSGKTTMDDITQAIGQLPEPARSTLLALAKTAGGSVTAFRTSVARWYDDNMDRVAGWYKRHVRLVVLALAFLFSVGFNINTITLARSLYTNRDARQALVGQADALTSCPPGQANACAEQATHATEALGKTSLPLFWQTTNPACLSATASCSRLERLSMNGTGGIALAIIGWLISTAALSMGAPFWFDLLNRIASLRSSGAPPPRASTQPSVPEPTSGSDVTVVEK